jgi:hypothetical protein
MIIANEPTSPRACKPRPYIDGRVSPHGLVNRAPTLTGSSLLTGLFSFYAGIWHDRIKETGDITIMSIKSVFVNIISSFFSQ